MHGFVKVYTECYFVYVDVYNLERNFRMIEERTHLLYYLELVDISYTISISK